LSEVVEAKLPCPNCPSSDAYHLYDDGHGHCFSCGVTTFPDGAPTTEKKTTKTKDKPLIEFGRYQALTNRGIDEETCEKFGYFIGHEKSGQAVQVAPYRNKKGKVVAQKVRGPNKKFYTTGDFEDVQLFGQHLWKDGGRRILVVEGEIDALSGAQMLGTWPVVSIPSGAPNAAKAIKANIEFLESYEKVVFGFDMDDAGRTAVAEVVDLLTPGKALIMELPLKDANDMLKEGRVKEFVNAFWEAKEYRPDGVLSIADIRERILTPPEIGLPWWLESLSKVTYGRRWGETYAFGAGTGIGKTDFLTQQVQFDVDVLKEKVGLFFLEQNPAETAKRVAGKFAGKRFHVPDGSWTQAELVEVVDRLQADNRIYLYDNFGALEWEIVEGTIKYLFHSKGVRIFYLDHLTALAAAEEKEKEALEKIMARMAQLAKALGVIIHFVSHLSTPEGKSHEEGGRVMIKHFKGSRSIGFWAHFMFGLERDTQDEDPAKRKITTFRVLKDRYTGDANGWTTWLGYDSDKGLLHQSVPPEELLSASDLLDDGGSSDY
jgi:twinkle protein